MTCFLGTIRSTYLVITQYRHRVRDKYTRGTSRVWLMWLVLAVVASVVPRSLFLYPYVALLATFSSEQMSFPRRVL